MVLQIAKGVKRRECHWVRVRAEVPVDWVPLSSVTSEPFGVVRSGWKLKWSWRIWAHLKRLGSEGKDSIGLRKGLLKKSKGNGGWHLGIGIWWKMLAEREGLVDGVKSWGCRHGWDSGPLLIVTMFFSRKQVRNWKLKSTVGNAKYSFQRTVNAYLCNMQCCFFYKEWRTRLFPLFENPDLRYTNLVTSNQWYAGKCSITGSQKRGTNL